MQVTNIDKGPRGLNAKSGPVLVEPGQTVDVELSDAELKVSKGTGWFEFGAADKAPAKEPAAGAYEVKETSSGWFAVTQDGKPVTKSLRKDDLKDFDAMSVEDKAAFVELHKAS